MTRKLCSLFSILIFMLGVSSCSLFGSGDETVAADQLDEQSLSIDDQSLDAGDELLDESDDLLAEASSEAAGGDDNFDGDDGLDDDFSDESFADDSAGAGQADSFENIEDDLFTSGDNLDQDLVGAELDEGLGNEKAMADEFVADAEPVIDEPAPEEPVIDVPGGAALANNQVTNLEYKAYEGGGTVVIETSAPAQFQMREEPDLNQVVVEVDGVSLPERFKRPYITKDFKQDIATINAYQDQGGSTARFVIQMKRPVTPAVQQEGTSILVMTGAPTAAPIEQPVVAVTEGDSKQTMSGALGLPDNSNTLGNIRYMGEKISLEVTDVDIRDVVENIAQQSGVNLIMDADVKGPVSMRLRDIPWDQALMVTLKTNGLGYVKQGNVLRIAKQATLSKEAQEISAQIESENKAKLLAGGIKVKYIPVSYAKVEDLVKKMKDFTSKEGKLTHDERTSSLVITDYDEYIGRIAKLIKALDTPPMQVEIESKIVEAREEFVRELGLNWGTGGVDFPVGAQTGNIQSRTSPRQAGVTRSGLELDLSVGTFDILGNLTAQLGLYERQNKIKVLSQPKIQTMNKTKAKVEQVTQIPIQVVTNQNGNTTTTVEYRDLKLSLEVTPQITFIGDVILDVKLQRDFPGPPGTNGNREINKRAAETTVMVKNGHTAVIGGIYQVDDGNVDQGVPWLKDIPIIGYLFKALSKEKRKSELLLFLKPKIMKEVEGPILSSAKQEGEGLDDMSLDEGGFSDDLEDADFAEDLDVEGDDGGLTL
ncbi:MAG: type IV pilus secretin PilQ [Bdellovibrionales bacterium]|nr:type IV pilus secretin PilQ [Bdellovibrionales bacterium]